MSDKILSIKEMDGLFESCRPYWQNMKPVAECPKCGMKFYVDKFNVCPRCFVKLVEH